MKKILVFLADGFEEIEALTLVDVLRRANVQVDTCSLEEKLVRGTHDIYVQADVLLDEDLDEYDGIYLPGGMPGAKNLQENSKVQEMIKEYFSKGKLVSAICAAPIALNSTGILKDKKGTSYPGFEDQLEYQEYVEAPVVVCDNLITSRGPATALLVAFEILNYLGYKNETETIKEDMLFHLIVQNQKQ
ncbi:DJ-1 family glyoxalase III [Alkalibaculum bacchi]|uniref:DJ-1 family glyoxalase III n=1 Tax=Alkalibaculum bacchi TaxID=645887 RepID=UPI0026F08F47|nr:DJ-1 family glyoxalase III [Alkalibaculum bacchi]